MKSWSSMKAMAEAAKEKLNKVAAGAARP